MLFLYYINIILCAGERAGECVGERVGEHAGECVGKLTGERV
jgi:hypothetical protein